MKKSLVLGAVLLLASVIHAGSPIYVSAPGTTLVKAGAQIVESITIGNLAGGNTTLKVYDSATAAGISASNLKYAIGLSPSITQTAGSQRVMVLNAAFSNGVVVSSAGDAVTITTTTNLHSNN